MSNRINQTRKANRLPTATPAANDSVIGWDVSAGMMVQFLTSAFGDNIEYVTNSSGQSRVRVPSARIQVCFGETAVRTVDTAISGTGIYFSASAWQSFHTAFSGIPVVLVAPRSTAGGQVFGARTSQVQAIDFGWRGYSTNSGNSIWLNYLAIGSY